jgi:hypothetical protein
MKTTVEINDYLITIEEVEGNITVSATKDEEVVEEFTIEVEEGQNDESDDVQGFGEFGQDEEEDFGQNEDESDEDESDEEEFGQDEEEELEGKLESFQSFINKKRN